MKETTRILKEALSHRVNIISESGGHTRATEGKVSGVHAGMVLVTVNHDGKSAIHQIAITTIVEIRVFTQT